MRDVEHTKQVLHLQRDIVYLERELAHQKKLVQVLAWAFSRPHGETDYLGTYSIENIIQWAESKVKEQEAKP